MNVILLGFLCWCLHANAKSSSEKGFDKLMVVGGGSIHGLNDGERVEVVNLLSDGILPCNTNIPDPPHKQGSSGGFVNGRAVICGGTRFALVRI